MSTDSPTVAAAPASPPMSWKRSAYTVIALIPVIALLYFGLTTDPRNIASPLPGTVAPAFTLQRMDGGGAVSLAADSGSVVVLNFWASWCEPCRWEHPELIRVANEYTPRGVKFYGILDATDTKDGAAGFLRELGAVPYATLLPGRTHVGIDYGITGIPETFIIGRDGIVKYKKTGPWCPVNALACGVPGERQGNFAFVLDSILALQ